MDMSLSFHIRCVCVCLSVWYLRFSIHFLIFQSISGAVGQPTRMFGYHQCYCRIVSRCFRRRLMWSVPAKWPTSSGLYLPDAKIGTADLGVLSIKFVSWKQMYPISPSTAKKCSPHILRHTVKPELNFFCAKEWEGLKTEKWKKKGLRVPLVISCEVICIVRWFFNHKSHSLNLLTTADLTATEMTNPSIFFYFFWAAASEPPRARFSRPWAAQLRRLSGGDFLKEARVERMHGLKAFRLVPGNYKAVRCFFELPIEYRFLIRLDPWDFSKALWLNFCTRPRRLVLEADVPHSRHGLVTKRDQALGSVGMKYVRIQAGKYIEQNKWSTLNHIKSMSFKTR